MNTRAKASIRIALFLVVAQTTGCVVTPMSAPGAPPRSATIVRDTASANSDTASLPNEIAASHLLVQYQGAQSARAEIARTKEEARARAEEALAKARAGEDFGTLVGLYSDEPGAAERKGALGRFPHHAMVKPFADAAFRLKVGEISGVVESPFGFHVIQRTE